MKKLINILFIVIALTFVFPFNVSAKTLNDIKKELDAAQKKLDETNVKKAANKQSINETSGKINKIKGDIVSSQNEIDAKTKESEQLEKDIVKKNEETKDLMRYYQVTSSGSAMLEYIMGAKDIADLVYRLSITEQISSYNKKEIKKMNEMIEENNKIKEELAKKKEALGSLQSDLEVQVSVLNQQQIALNKEGESEEEVVKNMQKELKYYKSIGCRDTESISSCYSRIYGSGYLPSGTTFYRPTTSGRISSEFGNRTLYGKANKHFAIDISMPIGTPVYAVAPGVVGYTGDICGISLVVWHNINGKTYSSIYCHLSKQLVKKGQTVSKDTMIAKSGNTGISTGPHLHLGLATGKYKDDYYFYYSTSKGDSLENHTFNPRNVITFPALGASYSNR